MSSFRCRVYSPRQCCQLSRCVWLNWEKSQRSALKLTDDTMWWLSSCHIAFAGSSRRKGGAIVVEKISCAHGTRAPRVKYTTGGCARGSPWAVPSPSHPLCVCRVLWVFLLCVCVCVCVLAHGAYTCSANVLPPRHCALSSVRRRWRHAAESQLRVPFRPPRVPFHRTCRTSCRASLCMLLCRRRRVRRDMHAPLPKLWRPATHRFGLESKRSAKRYNSHRSSQDPFRFLRPSNTRQTHHRPMTAQDVREIKQVRPCRHVPRPRCAHSFSPAHSSSQPTAEGSSVFYRRNRRARLSTRPSPHGWLRMASGGGGPFRPRRRVAPRALRRVHVHVHTLGATLAFKRS